MDPGYFQLADEDNSTCYGFKDRINQTVTNPVHLRLQSYNPILDIHYNGVTDCTELMDQIPIATTASFGGCPFYKQCELIKEGANDKVCTVRCSCKESPCQIHSIYHSTMSHAQICEVQTNSNTNW